MISPTAEYALRAVVALARAGDTAMVTSKIAETTLVPPGYLSKVLQMLRRKGVVRSKRGLGGGFVLAKHPGELTVLDVVNAVDPIKRIEQCPLRIDTHGRQLCSLHRRLDAAAAMVQHSFAETTVAEILADRDHIAPLCEPADCRRGVCDGSADAS